MDALSLLNEGNGICAVVSDLMMGGPVGIDFLEEVRRRAPACARILVSGTMLEREIREVLQSGAIQKFVSKPWQPGELLTAVRGAVDACPRAGE